MNRSPSFRTTWNIWWSAQHSCPRWESTFFRVFDLLSVAAHATVDMLRVGADLHDVPDVRAQELVDAGWCRRLSRPSFDALSCNSEHCAEDVAGGVVRRASPAETLRVAEVGVSFFAQENCQRQKDELVGLVGASLTLMIWKGFPELCKFSEHFSKEKWGNWCCDTFFCRSFTWEHVTGTANNEYSVVRWFRHEEHKRSFTTAIHWT